MDLTNVMLRCKESLTLAYNVLILIKIFSPYTVSKYVQYQKYFQVSCMLLYVSRLSQETKTCNTITVMNTKGEAWLRRIFLRE